MVLLLTFRIVSNSTTPASLDTLKQSEEYVSLGMFSDAWDVIEDLLPEEKTSESGLVIRLLFSPASLNGSRVSMAPSFYYLGTK